MRKGILITILLVVAFILVIVLVKGDNVKESYLKMSNNIVNFTLKEGTLTNKSGTFILKNNGNEEMTYGSSYHLEEKKNNKWYKLKNINDMFFTSVAYNLFPTEEIEVTVKWDYHYGELKPGTYRVVKSLTYENGKYKGDSINVGAEFTIE